MSSFYEIIGNEVKLLEGDISQMCVASDVNELHSSLSSVFHRLAYICFARLVYLNAMG